MKNIVIICWAINQIIELMTTFIHEQIIQISFANQIQLFNWFIQNIWLKILIH